MSGLTIFRPFAYLCRREENSLVAVAAACG